MKTFKKLLFLSLLVCFTFLVGSNNQQSFFSANSAGSPLIENQTTDIFNYISITQSGQALTNENVKVDGNVISVYANESATITFRPFERNYTISSQTNSSYFVPKTNTITIQKTNPTSYPDNFEYKGTTYYFRINQEVLSIYRTNPSLSGSSVVTTSTNNELISFIENDTQIVITVTDSYTLLSSAPNATFIFTASNLNTIREIHFIRPIINFSNSSNPVVQFNTFEQNEIGEYFPTTDTIQSEQTFNKVQIDFINNNYTEDNPLYFDINYNGFTYSLMLYSKEYSGSNCFFVNYYDNNNANNDYYIATPLILNEDEELIPDTRFLIDASTNLFSMVFENTGRYAFEIYDSTYVYEMNNANYYATSFYIIDKSASDFENIYMIAQTTEDDGSEIEYIVSTATLNNNVKLSIKNLLNLSGDRPLDEVIDHVEVIQALFGGSGNIPIPTSYSVDEILQMIDENGDLVFNFSEDAYYQVYVYPYVEEGQEQSAPQPKLYEFTLVKQAKTTFTFDGYTYEATIPYHTEIIDYSVNINSPMEFKVKFTTIQEELDQNINKTYVNEYQIMFGMEDALIQRVETQVSEDEESNQTDSMTIEFYGVGNLTITVTFNNQETIYDLNSEEGRNSLVFTEYGTYYFELVDSMGTTRTAVYTLEKQLNVSAIVLIVLSCVIVAAVVIFILVARSRIKTR